MCKSVYVYMFVRVYVCTSGWMDCLSISTSVSASLELAIFLSKDTYYAM